MTDIENIHRHLEKLVLESPAMTALIARYADIYTSDNRTIATLLQALAERDPFFIGLHPDEFKHALSTYKMPLAK